MAVRTPNTIESLRIACAEKGWWDVQPEDHRRNC